MLGGADFGAGFWFFAQRARRDGRHLREHAYNAMGPVWEANHVWLIFVLVVCWTAYPVAFASIASTLAVPLFIAAVGIIMRGTAYALRSGSPSRRQDSAIGLVFSLSSVLTPFALGTAVGAIASGRVPVGNAKGDLVSSWLNPTSLLIGVLAVATAAYLAAVFLAADAARLGDERIEDGLPEASLAAGVVAGAIALGGLAVVRETRAALRRPHEGGGLGAWSLGRRRDRDARARRALDGSSPPAIRPRSRWRPSSPGGRRTEPDVPPRPDGRRGRRGEVDPGRAARRARGRRAHPRSLPLRALQARAHGALRLSALA